MAGSRVLPVDPARHAAELSDNARLAALQSLGLTSGGDTELDRYAERVVEALDVPVALVSLVTETGQHFPGMVGLAAPWCEQRATPLSHSLCQYVVSGRCPLVLADVAGDPATCDHPAFTDLQVAAYAGMPLRTRDGHVLGALCAIDTRPRQWSPDDLARLGDLAHDAENALRVRLVALAADAERRAMTQLHHQLSLETARSRWMLAVVEALNTTRTEAGVRARLERLGDEVAGFESVRLHLVPHLDGPAPDLAPGSLSPAVHQAARQYRMVVVPDLDHGPDAPRPDRAGHRDHVAVPDLAALRTHYAGAGVRAVAAVPVLGTGELFGVLELLWSAPRPLDEQEQRMLLAVASHTAQALDRAHLIERRTGVAHQLQQAMLSPLPEVPGLAMAAVYVPATAEEWVGGDWYDAYLLPSSTSRRQQPSRPLEAPATPATTVALTVGDVLGHDIPAAGVMGQARAMLRQASFDHPDAGPAAAVTSFEEACQLIGVEACGSAVLGYLHRRESPGWRMTWTSAGHPPALLALPDGRVRRLALPAGQQGLLFGYRDLYDQPRHDATVDLPVGSTVLMYTDGVIEVPGSDLDRQLGELADLLAEQQGRGPQAVVDTISMTFGTGGDDLVALAVQVTG